MRAIRIAIVDDHEVVRVGLRLTLDAEPDLEVVGEAGSAASAIALARDQRPDVMLLDVHLDEEDADGPEAVAAVLEASPRTAVLLLLDRYQHTVVRQSQEAGAKGHVTKRAGLEEIKRAVRAVHRDGTMPGSAVAPAEPWTAKLSPTDLAIIHLLTQGLSNKAIAARVQRSPYTVKDHLRKIGAVLAVRSRTEIVAQALRHRIV